jgi:hypothetical protein
MHLKATRGNATVYAPAAAEGARSLFALGATEILMQPDADLPLRGGSVRREA